MKNEILDGFTPPPLLVTKLVIPLKKTCFFIASTSFIFLIKSCENIISEPIIDDAKR